MTKSAMDFTFISSGMEVCPDNTKRGSYTSPIEPNSIHAVHLKFNQFDRSIQEALRKQSNILKLARQPLLLHQKAMISYHFSRYF